MVKAINKTGEYQNLKDMEQYLDENDKNETIYHRINEEISCKLQAVIDNSTTLIRELGEAYFKLQEYYTGSLENVELLKMAAEKAAISLTINKMCFSFVERKTKDANICNEK